MGRWQETLDTVQKLARGKDIEQFRIDAADFLSARERGEAAGTRIEQMSASLEDSAEIVNRSFPQRDATSGQYTNVISPVVIPKDHRSYLWVAVVLGLELLGLIGAGTTATLDGLPGVGNLSTALFGPHYWLVLLGYAAFNLWRNSFVKVPDGCQALITRFGKLEEIAGPGRKTLLNPWKRVSYIINTTREYPYNAPIREAPTAERVNASVDLFLQFKIEDPAQFIFALGGAKGFSEKLQNAISEVTRALIYEQKAEDIYDLIGESTQALLESLNQQFLPAVRFVNANITHAEPSSQEYRMDLAAPEMVRVAKEAYTWQYELKLRKEQDEGDLNKELASLQEKLSAIRAEIATYQARIDTAREKEIHRANAYARQLLSEAESAAKANAALLEAQALDIRAVSSASYPEILQYRFQQDVLDRLEAVAGHLPQVIDIGVEADQRIDFLETARHMLGITDQALYSEADIQGIRGRTREIQARIQARDQQLQELVAAARVDEAAPGGPA
ncbi:SPFH domain-containing protein [Archangium sp.]|uniref:SPFH domain-containing protein n=1 Tax=Archangium sp. TaxID=1872627 RepID=UPI002D2DD1BB|nr:SPFH domain-containing protein [Archangium sp.]HYO54077.1 SPFH domain-containing protein [Archangium sp.]